MISPELHSKLISNGWKSLPIDQLPANKLNEGISALYTFNNALSLRDHAGENFLRLLISNMSDSACLQMPYSGAPDAIVDYIIGRQNAMSPSDYFTDYFALQSICEVSILATEQFL